MLKQIIQEELADEAEVNENVISMRSIRHMVLEETRKKR